MYKTLDREDVSDINRAIAKLLSVMRNYMVKGKLMDIQMEIALEKFEAFRNVIVREGHITLSEEEYSLIKKHLKNRH